MQVETMIELKQDFLKGSYPPLITPFRDGEVDYDVYQKLVDFQIRNGSHGIVVNGTTSEPSTLTVQERNKLVDVGLQAAGGRVPVVTATGSQSHAETVALSEYAQQAGVNALLIVTPYYIRPPQRGLAAYYEDLGERTDLPILMYHIPGRTAVAVTLDTLKRIVEVVPNFVGMKHAVNDLALVSDALAAFGPEFRIFVGLEELSYPMLCVGACGMMNAVSNVAPDKVAALYRAVAEGNLEGGRRLHFDLWELNKSIFFDTNPIPMKYMLKRLGIIPANEHRLPMLPAQPELERRLDEVLKNAGMLTADDLKRRVAR